MEELDSIRDIDKLSTLIIDNDFREGLNEIIEQLKRIKINTKTMNSTTLVYTGHKEALEKIINYLERCL